MKLLWLVLAVFVILAAIGKAHKTLSAQQVERQRAEFGSWQANIEGNGWTDWVYVLKHHKTQTCWLIVSQARTVRTDGGIAVIEAPQAVCQ